MRYAFILCVICTSFAVADDATVTIKTSPYWLPPLQAVVCTKVGTPGPHEKQHQALTSISKTTEPLIVTTTEPVDLWLVPKDGLPLKVLEKQRFQGKAEIDLTKLVGVIRVKGAELPRGVLIVTPFQDRGPEDKMHQPLQRASDTRTEMIVKPGDYGVWLQPSSGARARQLADKVRVFAGKTADID